MIQLKTENVQTSVNHVSDNTECANLSIESSNLTTESADLSNVSSTPPLDNKLPKVKIGNNLKKLKSFKNLKKNYKLQSQKEVFVNDVKSLLQYLDKDEHQYDIEVLVEVINACEDFFIYGNKEERTRYKTEAINELMMDFFENEKVLNKFMGIIKPQIKKSNFLRRTLKKITNFFL